MARTITIPVTTDAGGAATATRVGLHGRVLKCAVDAGDMTAGAVDVTITDDLSGSAIAAFTNVTGKVVIYPTVIPTTTAGAALATAGPVANPVLSGRVKVVVAQGGNVKSGTVYVTVE